MNLAWFLFEDLQVSNFKTKLFQSKVEINLLYLLFLFNGSNSKSSDNETRLIKSNPIQSNWFRRRPSTPNWDRRRPIGTDDAQLGQSTPNWVRERLIGTVNA